SPRSVFGIPERSCCFFAGEKKEARDDLSFPRCRCSQRWKIGLGAAREARESDGRALRIPLCTSRRALAFWFYGSRNPSSACCKTWLYKVSSHLAPCSVENRRTKSGSRI